MKKETIAVATKAGRKAKELKTWEQVSEYQTRGWNITMKKNNKEKNEMKKMTAKETKKIEKLAQEIREEKKMEKFEVNGIEYRFNEETGRYSKTENGKTKRIGKAEYEEAAKMPTDVKTIPCEQGGHAVHFAKIGTYYGVKLTGEDTYQIMDKDEIKSEIYPKDGDMKFYATFEFLGRKYWLKDAMARGAKKSKGSGRSKKNVAYKKQFGDMEVCLTEKQVDFFHHMQDTCFWEKGLDSTPWIDVLCDEIGGQFENKPMTVGAMVSTLREKELLDVVAERVNGRKAKYFALTPSGKDVARDLGLK